ncbi:radical SAM family heme chaperone HemW [Herbiconiux sp. KACC 21604]|uniref:radical SAM family heme chaperone HemW n=1 Tax=unclassified Herbiconiux TaxID=2618217 RepID=UPI00149237C3|nr:radical SAM family heme chaperone HemW [Herbiconiux sp. SALV-R1]QJU53020.1 coproporphyrinogen III oxidase [Herbiconiux sp. SALV-R1]WPO87955.1 radical SAM family heme chaperone HemW [Herbiconiux sp. KACC 21604]
MPSILPVGDPAPADGLLPAQGAASSATRDLGLYVHVPFCRVRCGYCDFNTYTATELRGVKQSDYASQAVAEMRFGAGVLRASGVADRELSTVFFGGGTPTLLPSAQLVQMVHAARDTWGFAPDAEITTEANPDSVDARYLGELADAGFTRVSFGMQSAVPNVLATLERTHDPERIPLVVRWAKEAGLEVSLDLIYGTPGETLDDWSRSLDAVLENEPGHVSAYALIVEEGTKLARQIRSGEVAEPSDDLQADMYEMADARLADAGFHWYEVSNWARTPEQRSRHNLGYWLGHDWWGIGPGSHSFVGDTRWWNVKHPAAYAQRIAAGESPAAGRETIDSETRELERILLLARVRDGLGLRSLAPEFRQEVAGLIADGLIDGPAALRGSLVLTLSGRLLADAVVRRLT